MNRGPSDAVNLYGERDATSYCACITCGVNEGTGSFPPAISELIANSLLHPNIRHPQSKPISPRSGSVGAVREDNDGLFSCMWIPLLRCGVTIDAIVMENMYGGNDSTYA